MVQKTEPAGHQANIIPLADMAFILLVFFLLVTVLGTFTVLTSDNPKRGIFIASNLQQTEIETNLPVADYGLSKELQQGLVTIRFVEVEDDSFHTYILDSTVPTVDSLARRIQDEEAAGNVAMVSSLKETYGFFPINIGLDDSNSYILPDGIRDKIRVKAKELIGQEIAPIVFVKADQGTCYGWITDIFNICKNELKINNVSFEVRILRMEST